MFLLNESKKPPTSVAVAILILTPALVCAIAGITSLHALVEERPMSAIRMAIVALLAGLATYHLWQGRRALA